MPAGMCKAIPRCGRVVRDLPPRTCLRIAVKCKTHSSGCSTAQDRRACFAWPCKWSRESGLLNSADSDLALADYGAVRESRRRRRGWQERENSACELSTCANMSNKARYEEWSNLNPVLLSFHPCLSCRASKTLHFAVLGFTVLLWACIPDNPTRNCYLLSVLTFCAKLHAFSTIRLAFRARWHKHQQIPYIQYHVSLFTTSYCFHKSLCLHSPQTL